MAKKKKRVARKTAKSKKKVAPRKKAARHPRTRREAPQLEASPLSKLDPMLRLGARRAKKEARGTESIAPGGCPSSIRDLSIGIHSLASRMSKAGAERLQKEDLVSVVIDCRPGASVRERVDEWGGCGTRVTDSTVVARVPRTELEALARLPAVRYVEASTKLKLHSDLAHVSSGLVRAGARTVPQTGTGVLVGVVDTGIDVSHPAFQSGGKTRIVELSRSVHGPGVRLREDRCGRCRGLDGHRRAWHARCRYRRGEWRRLSCLIAPRSRAGGGPRRREVDARDRGHPYGHRSYLRRRQVAQPTRRRQLQLRGTRGRPRREHSSRADHRRAFGSGKDRGGFRGQRRQRFNPRAWPRSRRCGDGGTVGGELLAEPAHLRGRIRAGRARNSRPPGLAPTGGRHPRPPALSRRKLSRPAGRRRERARLRVFFRRGLAPGPSVQRGHCRDLRGDHSSAVAVAHELDPGGGRDRSGKRRRRRGARLDSRRRGRTVHLGCQFRVPHRDAGDLLLRRHGRLLRDPEPVELARPAEPLDPSRGARARGAVVLQQPWSHERRRHQTRGGRPGRVASGPALERRAPFGAAALHAGFRESSTRRFEGRACRRLTSRVPSPFSFRKTGASTGARPSDGSSNRRGRTVIPASAGTPGGAMANWTWSDSSRSSLMPRLRDSLKRPEILRVIVELEVRAPKDEDLEHLLDLGLDVERVVGNKVVGSIPCGEARGPRGRRFRANGGALGKTRAASKRLFTPLSTRPPDPPRALAALEYRPRRVTPRSGGGPGART